MKKHSTKTKSQRGDTLIEIAFALVIIGFIVAVAIQGAIKAHQAAVTARKRTQATFIAQSQLELLEASRRYYNEVDPSTEAPLHGGWGNGSGSDEFLSFLRGGAGAAIVPPSCPVPLNDTFSIYPISLFMTTGTSSKIVNSATNPNDPFPQLANNMDALEIFPDSTNGNNIADWLRSGFMGFTVSNRAVFTNCGGAGYGINDITVTTTVTWNDTNGREQKVEMSNRLTNN